MVEDDQVQLNDDAGALYRRGMEYYDSDEDGARDYAKAAECFRLAAGLGDTNAMLMLGECYEHGIGVGKDLQAAEMWRDRSASHADVWLADRQENHYLSGGPSRGLDPDDDAGVVAAYRRDAERGDAWGQYKLGRCSQYGFDGQEPDDTEADRRFREAVASWRLAAEQGDAEAQYQLGRCCGHGFGVTPDDGEMVKWYRLAAGQGYLLAQLELVRYFSRQPSGEAKSESVRWLRLAAEQGDAEAQNNLACLYAEGLGGLARDDAEAVYWYGKAAWQRDCNAMHNLAVHYCLGQGVDQSYGQAADLFQDLAARGNAAALYNMACLYHHGFGMRKSPAIAMDLCRDAAEKGQTDAALTLGCQYYWGIGVGRDVKKAVRWLGKACSCNYPNRVALRLLGECAAMGADVREYQERAMKAREEWMRDGKRLEMPPLYEPVLGRIWTSLAGAFGRECTI